MNLTFGTHLQLHSFSNVKFKNSTRFNNLLVVLLIPTFANMGAATSYAQKLVTVDQAAF